MKKTTQYPPVTGARSIARDRFLLISILGTLAFVGALFLADATGATSAFGREPNADFAEQGKVSYVDEEQENAYRAAKNEVDLKKRAEKLYEFYQKYPNSYLLESADFKIIKPIEEEHGAYYAAMQETDPGIRATKLIEFLQKHPDSSLKMFVEQEYTKMLKEASQGKKYEQLENLAGMWLKIHPNNKETYAFLAEAAMNLKKHEKSAEYLEALYAIDPLPSLAREIVLSYQRAQNLPKQLAWAEKLFKMPEFEKDYMLRYSYVMKFSAENDLHRAAEYARLTLQSADLIKQPDGKTEEQLSQVRRACHHVIASDLMEKGKFADAIASFKEAIAAEKYGEGYYKIGQCLENLKQIEDAMLYYAKAVLLGGEYSDKAKIRLELLYKALHNDTLIGIDKIYNKAKEIPDT